MFDYHQDAAFAAHRYRTARLLDEARAQRLARAVRVYRPALHHYLLARAGDWLIATGTTLKARVDPLPTTSAGFAPVEFGGGAERL